MSTEVVKGKSSEIELKDKLVSIQRNQSNKVVATLFSAIVVVGNEKGVVGQGLGKANEVTDNHQGIEDAKESCKVAILNGTVPHVQEGKFGGARVFLKPAAHGTGVIAGGAMRCFRKRYVTDVLAKSKVHQILTTVKATLDALMKMRDQLQLHVSVVLV